MTLRLAIIGAGEVGATIAYAAAIKGLARSVVFVDKDHAKAVAQAQDLEHGAMFLPYQSFSAADMRGCEGADVVIISAGAKQAVGQTRAQLAEANVEMIRGLTPDLIRFASRSLILIVSNPVDLLTLVTLRATGFRPEQIFGSGTVLDTARFRAVLARTLNVGIRNVHADVLGEHGDSEVPIWSAASIGTLPINLFAAQVRSLLDDHGRKDIFAGVRDAAANVIAAKGVTNWAIGLSVARILEAVDRNEMAVLTVSRYLDNYEGLGEICLSLPTLVGREGAGALVPLNLSPLEMDALRSSATVVRNIAEKFQKNI